MRIFLIILLVLIVLVVLVCLSGVVIAISFRNGNPDWSVRYCGIRILPRPERKAKKKKAARKPSRSGSWKSKIESIKTLKSKKSTDGFKDYLMDRMWKFMQDAAGKSDMAGNVLHALPGPVRSLFRGISWYAIETDFVIGGEDAAECALLYGKVQSILQPLLGQSSAIVKVKRKKIALVCDFTADTCRWDFSCRFRIQIGALLAAGIGMLWGYFFGSKKAGADVSGKRI